MKEGSELIPISSDAKIKTDEHIDYIDTWKAMEDLHREGVVKSIGVCNFNRWQIERLLRIATVSPVTNQVRKRSQNLIIGITNLVFQIECHPYLNQKKLIEFCRSRGILITAYFPLGSPDRPWAEPDEPQLLDDLGLRQIANKYKRTPVQIVLRYQVQRGNITIVRSLTKSSIEDCIHIFDFELSTEDMRYIGSFECNGRICRFER